MAVRGNRETEVRLEGPRAIDGSEEIERRFPRFREWREDLGFRLIATWSARIWLILSLTGNRPENKTVLPYRPGRRWSCPAPGNTGYRQPEQATLRRRGEQPRPRFLNMPEVRGCDDNLGAAVFDRFGAGRFAARRGAPSGAVGSGRAAVDHDELSRPGPPGASTKKRAGGKETVNRAPGHPGNRGR